MISFESDTFILKSPPKVVSTFLATPANLLEILPQDRIENWKADEHGCSFKIKGLADIHLKLKSNEESGVVYVSSSDKPFSFELNIDLPEHESGSQIQAAFHADVNSFMAMMLKMPLTNFLNALGKALEAKYDGT